MSGRGLPRRPGIAARFLDEGADRRRMRPAANRRQVYGPAEARLDQRPDNEVRIGHAELGEEAQAEPGLDHALHPIVAWGAEHLAKEHAALDQGVAHRLEYLAVRPADVRFLMQLG